MKKILKLSAIIITILISCGENFCQTPGYNLSISNFQYTQSNELQFDIFIQSINASVPYKYAVGQYVLNFNSDIANGGTLSLSFVAGMSQLPSTLRPRNPKVDTERGKLLLSANRPQGPMGAFEISTVSPGTRVVRLKLATTAGSFSNAPINLDWCDSPNELIRTKTFANDGTRSNDVTSNGNHSVSNVTLMLKTGIQGLINLSGIHNRSDTVIVSLRNSVSPYQQRGTSKKVINAGTLSALYSFESVPSGAYYIQTNHFNSMETWSSTAPSFTENGAAVNYDFTNAVSKAYGNNMIQSSGVWGAYSGDVNQDGVIDATDIAITDNDAFNFVTGAYIETDLNADQVVDGLDVAMVDNNAFIFVSVVSP